MVNQRPALRNCRLFPAFFILNAAVTEEGTAASWDLIRAYVSNIDSTIQKFLMPSNRLTDPSRYSWQTRALVLLLNYTSILRGRRKRCQVIGYDNESVTWTLTTTAHSRPLAETSPRLFIILLIHRLQWMIKCSCITWNEKTI